MLPILFSYINAPLFLNLITTRTCLAFFLSLILSLVYGTRLIAYLKAHQGKGQPIREDGPKTHLSKKGTPTMGGLLVLGTSVLSTLLFANLSSPFVCIALFVLVIFAITGYIDDYMKVTKQTANAMSAKMKLLLHFSTALVAVLVISYFTPEELRFQLNFPYFKNLALNLWWFYIPFAMIVITGSSNAVNLSDGLDGLASGLLFFSFVFFMILAFIIGTIWAEYFPINAIPEASDITVLCAAIIGSLLGFLWFNAPPAKVFMGDVGSLALGALLGTISVMLKSEILLAIVGGVFVIEAISVMAQVFWFKKTGKRIFKMSPIHHHFEQLGWAETTVVFRFWIIAIILLVIGLISLI